MIKLNRHTKIDQSLSDSSELDTFFAQTGKFKKHRSIALSPLFHKETANDKIFPSTRDWWLKREQLHTTNVNGGDFIIFNFLKLFWS